MQSRSQSSFYQIWQNASTLIQYVANEVTNFYINPFQQHRQEFKLKGSVLPAYKIVYDLSTAKPSYNEVICTQYKESLRTFIQRNSNKIQTDRIHSFNILWQSYDKFVSTIVKRIFVYLDRYYTPSLQDGNLTQIAVNLFLKQVTTSKEKGFLYTQYVAEIRKARERRIISSNQMRRFSEAILVLDHKQLFPQLMKIFLEETEKFYNQFYEHNHNKEPSQYYQIVNNLIYFEKILAQSSITSSPLEERILHKLFEMLIVSRYTQKLITSPNGLKKFLNEQNIVSLKLIHQMYQRYQGFDNIRKLIYEYTIQEGDKMLQNLQNTIEQKENTGRSLQQLLLLYRRLEKLFSEGFLNQKEVEISFKNAFQKIVGRYQNMAESLLSYTRQILDKGEFEQHKPQIRQLFELLPSKDQFLQLYQSSLQKKILDGSFIYIIQKRFVQQLNGICGSESTKLIDKKIQDYVETLPISSVFMKQNPTRIIFQTKVLSYVLWQKRFEDQTTLSLNMIDPLLEFWNKFQELYSRERLKRKLVVLPFESKLVLNVRFNFMYLRIKCNLLQACIIYCLADANGQVSEQQIASRLTIDKILIQKLVETAPPFIKEKSPGSYIIDWDFTCKQITIDLDEKTDEDRKMPKSLMHNRDILIDAAVMKTMKVLKQSAFEKIAEQVCKKIKLFKPQSSNIKSSIQKLVKKYQLEECENGIVKYCE